MKKLIVLSLILFLVSCVKDNTPNADHFQILKEKEKLTVGSDHASFEGVFSFDGRVDAMTLQVGKDVHLHGADGYPVKVTGNAFTASVEGLDPGTLYYYRYLVDYGASADYLTEIDSFMTLTTLPMVETLEVMLLDSTEFRVKCRVLSEGGDAVTERGVCWNEYGDPTVDDHRMTHAEGGTGEYTCRLTGLPPFSTCYVKAYARNSMGVSYGQVMAFSTGEEVQLPVVTTVEVSGVTTTAASCLCQVVEDGGAAVYERGICWSTYPNPDITSSVYANGGGVGEYLVSMNNLEAGATYYVRAYAKNSKGIGYGDELVFTTMAILEPPLGCLWGLFSVGEGRQVWFSQGNLMYKASANSWGFAESQYEFVGADNTHIAENYSGWIDLFGWGTSGFDHGAVCWQPWSNLLDNPSYYAYGSQDYNLYDQDGRADWGYGVVMEDGEELTHPWRTLTLEEWNYLLHIRSTSSGIRFAKARVDGVNGVLLLPDYWSAAVYPLNNINQEHASFSSNDISMESFYVSLESEGVIFLPASGRRIGTEIDDIGAVGYYFSSTSKGKKSAMGILFENDFLEDVSLYRCHGCSVRLVRDVVR